MEPLHLKAVDATFANIKTLLGNSLSLAVITVDNGATIKAQIKVTMRARLIHTARLHATLIHANGFWEYYKEDKSGAYTRVRCGHG